MSSSRFEWWKAYFQVKRELEEESQEEVQREAKAQARIPRAGGRGRDRTTVESWHYDID